MPSARTMPELVATPSVIHFDVRSPSTRFGAQHDARVSCCCWCSHQRSVSVMPCASVRLCLLQGALDNMYALTISLMATVCTAPTASDCRARTHCSQLAITTALASSSLRPAHTYPRACSLPYLALGEGAPACLRHARPRSALLSHWACRGQLSLPPHAHLVLLSIFLLRKITIFTYMLDAAMAPHAAVNSHAYVRLDCR